MQAGFTDAIRAARDELTVEIAVSPAQMLEAQQLRYRVYCEERGFEPGNNGLEQDEFDPASRHVLVRSRRTGAVLGTVRVVLSDTGLDGFPMRRACEAWVLGPLPAMSTGEISRFALARDRSGVSPAAGALMRLSLVRGLVRISAEHGLTHWCAIMERTLLRLLRATGIHFLPVGPVVEYHGPCQPAVCGIGAMLHRMKLEQPAVWAYITDNGTLWSEAPIAQRISS
jgi:N-acyl-L-homoserine lactone synthetase